MVDGGEPRPEAVDAAAAWLGENRSRYTRDALRANLRKAGFTATEIGLAEERLGLEVAGPGTGRDLRRRAATVLILGTLATWTLVIAFFWIYGSQPERSQYDSASGLVTFGGIVLGACFLVVMLPSLVVIAASDRLRRGAEGALATFLAVPFVLVVILAGVCVGPYFSR